MQVSTSKGRGKPPEGKEILLFWSRLFRKLQINVPSVGFNSKTFELRFFQRELKLALKVSQRRKNLNSLQLRPDKLLTKEANAPLVPQSKGTPPFKPQFAIKRTCWCRCFTRSGNLFEIDQNISSGMFSRKSREISMLRWFIQWSLHLLFSESMICSLANFFQTL